MFEAKHDLLHRHLPLADHTGRIEQAEASQESQDQMPVVRIFPLHLAALCGQQGLECAEVVFNPAPPAPRPDQAWRRDGRGTTEQVVSPLARLVNKEHRDGPIGRARGPHPGISHAGPVEVVPPGPVNPGQKCLPCDPALVRQVEDLGALALHHQGPLGLEGHMRQQPRACKPAIGHHQGRRQPQAPSRQGCPCPTQHDLQPRQFVTAGPAGPLRGGAAYREIDRDHQLAVTDHHDQQQPIDPEPDAMCLTAIPGAHQAQLLAIRFEQAVIADPRPLPPTAGGRTFVLDMLLQAGQESVRPPLQLLDPLPLGQGPQEAAGEILVPAPDSTQLVVAAAAKQRGEHHPEDLVQQFRDRVQSPLDLLRQYLRQAQVTQRLLQRLQMPLSTGLLVLETPARLLEGTLLGLIRSELGACPGGHGLSLSFRVDYVWRRPWPKASVISSAFMKSLTEAHG